VFTVNSGPQPLPVDTPNDSGAPLDIGNPRYSPNHEYFNIAAFSLGKKAMRTVGSFTDRK
jgi:hypothetical protein